MMDGINNNDKLDQLINHIDSFVYELTSETETYNEAVDLLSSIYAKFYICTTCAHILQATIR